MTKHELLDIVNKLPNNQEIKFIFTTRCYEDTVNYHDAKIVASKFKEVKLIGNSISGFQIGLVFEAKLPFLIH